MSRVATVTVSLNPLIHRRPGRLAGMGTMSSDLPGYWYHGFMVPGGQPPARISQPVHAGLMNVDPESEGLRSCRSMFCPGASGGVSIH